MPNDQCQDSGSWGDEVADIDSTSSGSAGGSCLLGHHEEDDEVTILCELVGARNLAIHDVQDAGDIDVETLRPYCVVNFGNKPIHKTKVSEDVGPNPIWTVSTRSLFLLTTSAREMSENVMAIRIYSKRDNALALRLRLNANSLFLGQVTLDHDVLLSNCDQQRIELNIHDELGEESCCLGTLAVRFRVATESDMKIVRMFNQHVNMPAHKSQRAFAELMLESSRSELFDKSQLRPQARLVTETDEAKIAQSSFANALSSVFAAKSVKDKETGAEKRKVKPYPDPDRQEETMFMSSQEIHVETRRPSQNWVEAGSGTLGKLYCEILACHDLPNVDFGEAIGNVTDAFICLVYEDTCAMTEVIDDELSPHWLPWTQRAFCFGMMHPASILYIGVFDYDLGTSHEPIGRIAVNIPNLQHNTIHTLKYNLYPSSNVTDRTAVGSITIRVRIECHDEKAALLAALKPRPKIFVNVKKQKSFKVVRYTCFGEYDGEDQFDLTVARSYMNEIFEYKAAFGYAISDAARSLIFWRGQVEVFTVMVPLHSFLFFCMSVDLVERPYMIVPYALLCVSWVMLATLTIRRQHPSPWNTCPSFWHYLHILRTGMPLTPIKAIKEYEGDKEARAYEEAWQSRLEQDQLVSEHQFKLQEELNEIGDDNISTKISQSNAMIPKDILARLTRYQGMAGRYCGYFRFMKIILTWEESVVSFWITAGFLASGIITMILPWRFILTWTSRIVVWGFLGPHMKLVDLYFRADCEKEGKLKQLVQNFHVQSNLVRLRREEAVKTKDIKAIAFGKYSTQVPSFNIARHFDRPLPASSARLCRTTPKRGAHRRVSVVNLTRSPWIPGQQLFGVMIPRPEHEAMSQENEIERHKEKLKDFIALVENIVNSNGAESTKARLALNKLGFDAFVPIAFGYEVVPSAHEAAHSETEESNHDRKFSTRSRISVILTDDGSNTPCYRFGDKLLLESDGTSVYEIKSSDEHSGDEEGLEVVGLGRYGTMSEEFEDEKLASSPNEVLFERGDSLLAVKCKSSERVDIAFYRPSETTSTHAGEN